MRKLRDFLDYGALFMPLGWAMTLIDVGAKRLVSSPVDFLLDFFASCVISFFLFCIGVTVTHANISTNEEEDTKDKLKRFLIMLSVLLLITFGASTRY